MSSACHRRGWVRYIAIVLLGLGALGRGNAAEPPPSDDLLEYLGSSEPADEQWDEFITTATAERESRPRLDAVPVDPAKVEK